MNKFERRGKTSTRLGRLAALTMSHQELRLSGGSSGEPAVFGIVTVSDRASQGVYSDISGPAILNFFHEAIESQ